MLSSETTEPMRVRQDVIEECRRTIESPAKRRIRALLIPIIKFYNRVPTLGEGFQWGRHVGFPRGAKIGRFVYLGPGFEAHGPITVGDLTMISGRVAIVGNDHDYNTCGRATRLSIAGSRPVTTIEAEVWVGHSSLIREGVRIGRGAVVAAGAIVTKDVAPYSIVAGAPARMLKMRFSEADIRRQDAYLYGKEYVPE